jgi:hypothetical protein
MSALSSSRSSTFASVLSRLALCALVASSAAVTGCVAPTDSESEPDEEESSDAPDADVEARPAPAKQVSFKDGRDLRDPLWSSGAVSAPAPAASLSR